MDGDNAERHDKIKLNFKVSLPHLVADNAAELQFSSIHAPATRRTASIPNRKGTKALYSVIRQTHEDAVHEMRVVDLATGTSTAFSNDPRDRQVKWLGVEDLVIWLRDADDGATELWVGDMADTPTIIDHCVGRIGARADNLKIKRLLNDFDDIAIVIACPTTESGALHNPERETSGSGRVRQVRNALWYTTLRKKKPEESHESPQDEYILSPSKFINALRGTGLESPVPGSPDADENFDVSPSGLVFLSKDATGGSANYPSINAYYIPLKTFTELSRPRPQPIRVRDYEGRSSCPVFSPNGGSIAFLKKKHPVDLNDRNRVVVINNVTEFRVHLSIENARTTESDKGWHLSPYNISWSDDGKELYVVAVDQGIRRLFKIPAALSSIKSEPEPITGESKTPADVRHLRMVFSAPMDAANRMSYG